MSTPSTAQRKRRRTNTDRTSISELPRRLEQAMRDESASAVAALFTEDGSFWVADERTPTCAAACGREEIERLFAGWFGAVGLAWPSKNPLTAWTSTRSACFSRASSLGRSPSVRPVTRSRSEAGTSV